jgi:hypothetical protein
MALAEMSMYSLADEARVMLPSVYALICSHVPTSDSDAKINYTHIECLLHIFHQLASKAPGSLKTICGIKIMTGQPSDYEGSEAEMEAKRNEFMLRLKSLISNTTTLITQLNQAISNFTPEEKDKKKTAQTALRTTQNIKELTQALTAAKPQLAPNIHLSWRTYETLYFLSKRIVTVNEKEQNQEQKQNQPKMCPQTKNKEESCTFHQEERKVMKQ